MKLAIVRQRYNPYGGAERFVERALAALERQGVSVTLIARKWTPAAGRSGIVCDPFYLGRLWRDAGFARCVRRVVRSGAFDLVQSHERIPGCSLFRAGDGAHAAWLAQRSRRDGPLGRLWLRFSPWHRYMLWAEARMFRDPALKAVICISRMVRDDILRHYGVDAAKLHVLYNGVDLEDFHPRLAALHREALRQRLGVPQEAPVFLFVGSGFARKGVATLIEAAARMRHREARFWVVGKDKRAAAYLRRARRAGVGERFHFLGGQQDVRPYLGGADAFVLPTLYEPLSNAVLEALACGLPAVATTTCGAAELIRAGENGYVCAAQDAAGLAGHLDTLAQPGAAAAMREAARASVAHLSVEAMAQRLVELYGSLLPASPQL